MHRIDLPCDQTGFTTPPFDVHLKFLPSPGPGGWTLLALAAPGKPDLLVRWLHAQPGVERVRVGPGLAPRLLRARVAELPGIWSKMAARGRVHHLDLAADGHAAWFIEAQRGDVLALVGELGRVPMDGTGTDIHCRPVLGNRNASPVSRRQFEALSAAVALGYYEIPHRIDLRRLASRTGVSLGSISELLRRAEASILTQYVDSALMRWPISDEDAVDQFTPMENMLRAEDAVASPAPRQFDPRDATPSGTREPGMVRR